MFPRGWFPDSFFAPGYWPKTGAELPTGATTVGGKNRFKLSRLMLQMAKDRLREINESDRIKAERMRLIVRAQQEHRQREEQDESHKRQAAMAFLISEL